MSIHKVFAVFVGLWLLWVAFILFTAFAPVFVVDTLRGVILSPSDTLDILNTKLQLFATTLSLLRPNLLAFLAASAVPLALGVVLWRDSLVVAHNN